MLDLADEAFGETRYMIPVAPQCHPAEVSTWLRGRRFEAGYAWMKFVRGPEPPPSGRRSWTCGSRARMTRARSHGR